MVILTSSERFWRNVLKKHHLNDLQFATVIWRDAWLVQCQIYAAIWCQWLTNSVKGAIHNQGANIMPWHTILLVKHVVEMRLKRLIQPHGWFQPHSRPPNKTRPRKTICRHSQGAEEADFLKAHLTNRPQTYSTQTGQKRRGRPPQIPGELKRSKWCHSPIKLMCGRDSGGWNNTKTCCLFWVPDLSTRPAQDLPDLSRPPVLYIMDAQYYYYTGRTV